MSAELLARKNQASPKPGLASKRIATHRLLIRGGIWVVFAPKPGLASKRIATQDVPHWAGRLAVQLRNQDSLQRGLRLKPKRRACQPMQLLSETRTRFKEDCDPPLAHERAKLVHELRNQDSLQRGLRLRFRHTYRSPSQRLRNQDSLQRGLRPAWAVRAALASTGSETRTRFKEDCDRKNCGG